MLTKQRLSEDAPETESKLITNPSSFLPFFNKDSKATYPLSKLAAINNQLDLIRNPAGIPANFPTLQLQPNTIKNLNFLNEKELQHLQEEHFKNFATQFKTATSKEGAELLENFKKSFSNWKSMNDEKVAYQTRQFTYLINALTNINEEVVFLGIGNLDGTRLDYFFEQTVPSYLEEISKTQSVKVICVDGVCKDEFDNFKRNFAKRRQAQPITDLDPNKVSYQFSDKSKNIKIDFFNCFLPAEPIDDILNDDFFLILKTALDIALSQNKKVFIANHTQAWSLEDIIKVATVYNSHKGTHPNANLLQLYTQGGRGKVRYYLENLYEPASSDYKKSVLHSFEELMYDRIENEMFYPQNNEFYICENIKALSQIKEFTPEKFQASKSNDLNLRTFS